MENDAPLYHKIKFHERSEILVLTICQIYPIRELGTAYAYFCGTF